MGLRDQHQRQQQSSRLSHYSNHHLHHHHQNHNHGTQTLVEESSPSTTRTAKIKTKTKLSINGYINNNKSSSFRSTPTPTKTPIPPASSSSSTTTTTTANHHITTTNNSNQNHHHHVPPLSLSLSSAKPSPLPAQQPQPPQSKEWLKVLYLKQGVPDNYVPNSFLQDLRKNVNLEKHQLLDIILATGALTQQITSIVILICMFIFFDKSGSSITVAATATTGTTTTPTNAASAASTTSSSSSSSPSSSSSSVVAAAAAAAAASSAALSPENHGQTMINHHHNHNHQNHQQHQHSILSVSILFALISLITMCLYLSTIFIMPKNNVITELKSSTIFLVSGFAMSPILRTLTETISTDTIYAMVTINILVHLSFYNYGIPAAIVSKPISLNAAFFASICLASRLATSYHAFAFLMFAIDIFVLFGILYTKLQSIARTSMTVVFATVSLVMLYLCTNTMVYVVLYAGVIVFINFICPLGFYKMQVYKENIYGPWDEAIIDRTNFHFSPYSPPPLIPSTMLPLPATSLANGDYHHQNGSIRHFNSSSSNGVGAITSTVTAIVSSTTTASTVTSSSSSTDHQVDDDDDGGDSQVAAVAANNNNNNNDCLLYSKLTNGTIKMSN